LEKYQTTDKWAGKKANLKSKHAQSSAYTTNKGILAAVTAHLKRKEITIENIADFKWEDVPAISARVAAKHGNIPFQITLKLPNGTSFTIIFKPSAK
jgi:hypothetical protein